MLLPELEAHIPRTNRLCRLPNIPRRAIRSTKVDAHLRLQVALQPTEIPARRDFIPHGGKQPLEVGSPEIGAGLELGEGIEGVADGVEGDVEGGVDVEFLGEVGVDAEEGFVCFFAVGVLGGLGFERGEQGLEPFEGGGVFANPDEFDALETFRGVGPGAEMPDVFEDAGPGGHADAGADQDGDLVVEYILCWGTVGTVDTELGHLLAVLKRDLVHAHGIQSVVFLGL